MKQEYLSKNKLNFGNKISILSKIIGQIVKKNISINQPILVYYSSNYEISRFIFDIKNCLNKKFPISKMRAGFSMRDKKKQLQEIFEFQKKSIGIRISQNIQFYEGEIVNLQFSSNSPSDVLGNFFIILELKSSEGKLKLKISGDICEQFIKKKTKVGDIIRIFPEDGSVQNFGQSITFAKSDQIDNSNYFTVPNGKVFKKKILIKEFTLWDFEYENFGKKKYSDMLNPQTIKKLNDSITTLLLEYNKIGKIQIFRGILMIENIQFLNFNSFQFLCTDFFFFKFSHDAINDKQN